MRPVVELREVWKIYHLDGVSVEALKGVNVQVAKGEFIAVLGPSGSGKSTLLHIMGLLDRPTKGEVLLEGKNVANMSDSALSSLRNSYIGFVFQTFNLLPHLTALENVALPLLIKGVPKEEREKRAQEMLEKVGLGERLLHKPSELSGGQRQRVAIARALINNPKLILADEPTGNLDSKTGAEILELFSSLHEEGATIVIITHDDYVANKSERIIRIKDGVIL